MSEKQSTVPDKQSSRFSLSKQRTPMGRTLEDTMNEIKTEMRDYVDNIVTDLEEKNKKRLTELEAKMTAQQRSARPDVKEGPAPGVAPGQGRGRGGGGRGRGGAQGQNAAAPGSPTRRTGT